MYGILYTIHIEMVKNKCFLGGKKVPKNAFSE